MQRDDLTKIVGLLYIVIGLLFTISYKLNAIGVSTEAAQFPFIFQLIDFVMKFGLGYGLIVYGFYKAFPKKSGRE